MKPAQAAGVEMEEANLAGEMEGEAGVMVMSSLNPLGMEEEGKPKAKQGSSRAGRSELHMTLSCQSRWPWSR